MTHREATLQDALQDVVRALDALAPGDRLSDRTFALYHQIEQQLKGQVFGDRVKFGSARNFEYGWGAQTIQFAIDVMPFLHDKLLQHYHRTDVLEFVDIGAGTGAAAQLFAQLHSADTIFSRMNVHAVDYIDTRGPWISLNYPDISFAARDLFDITERYDIVYCSHCIEHVPDVDRFIAQLVTICRGFCFIYAPFEEREPIHGHVNRITREMFAPFDAETHVFRSMGWRPARPDHSCILAVIDCRDEKAAPRRAGLGR